jgi:hypothetical protein
MILYYALLLTLALADQRFFAYRIFGFTVEKYLGLLCLLVALIYLPLRKSPVRLWRSGQTRAFLIFFVLAAASWLTLSRARFPDSMMLVYVSDLAFLISTVILVDSPRRLRWSLLAAMGGVAWAALYALREWQKAAPIYGLGYRPEWSPAGDPNYFTASAVLCLPIAFYLFAYSRKRFDRLFAAACMLPIIGAVLVDASRGGLVAIIAAGAVIFLRSRGRRGLFLALAGALGLVLLLSPASPVRRLLHPKPGDIAAANDRLELWSAGLRMVEAHPLTGIGLGNFEAEVPRYLAPGQHIDFIAHNTYIEMAAELGLPGLVLFLAILLCGLQSLRRTRQLAEKAGSTLLYNAASGLEAGLIGFAVAMFFLSAEFLKILWFAVFLSSAMAGLRSESPEAATEKEICPGWPDKEGTNAALSIGG